MPPPPILTPPPLRPPLQMRRLRSDLEAVGLIYKQTPARAKSTAYLGGSERLADVLAAYADKVRE